MMPQQDPFFSRLRPQHQQGGLHHRALMTQLGGAGGALVDASVPGLTPQITPDPMGGGRMPWQLATPDQLGQPGASPIPGGVMSQPQPEGLSPGGVGSPQQPMAMPGAGAGLRVNDGGMGRRPMGQPDDPNLTDPNVRWY